MSTGVSGQCGLLQYIEFAHDKAEFRETDCE